MIRVTSADNSVKELVYMIDTSNAFYMTEFIVKYKVVKLEKQVKDLTTQEIYKLFSNCYSNDLDSIDVCEDGIYVNWFDYGEKTYSEYFYDDYIDITCLIKE